MQAGTRKYWTEVGEAAENGAKIIAPSHFSPRTVGEGLTRWHDVKPTTAPSAPWQRVPAPQRPRKALTLSGLRDFSN